MNTDYFNETPFEKDNDINWAKELVEMASKNRLNKMRKYLFLDRKTSERDLISLMDKLDNEEIVSFIQKFDNTI